MGYDDISLIFIAFFGFLPGTTYADLMPQSFPADIGIQKMEGDINVWTSVPSHTTTPTYKSMDVDEWLYSKKLKKAIENSIEQHLLFSQVTQGDPDYILDVWVEKIQDFLDIGGEGFVFDFMSVWRLTRVNDGKVVACEFIKGHGGSSKLASSAYPAGISAATRNMIQRGLVAITDQSQSHLTALSTAGSRTSISHQD